MFQKIKDIRISKDMTQEELAEKSGISRTTIHGLETGKITNTNTDTLLKIAAALGITIDGLFLDQSV